MSAMQAAQQRQKHVADTRLRAVEFSVGDKVFLSTTNIKLKFKSSPKLLVAKMAWTFISRSQKSSIKWHAD
jgi:hypothetical protein